MGHEIEVGFGAEREQVVSDPELVGFAEKIGAFCEVFVLLIYVAPGRAAEGLVHDKRDRHFVIHDLRNQLDVVSEQH